MRSKKTLAELTAWLSRDDSGAKPDAQALADFLGIELAEPKPPVGQRRRSPDGCEVVKTSNGAWFTYQRIDAPEGSYWRSPSEVIDWEVITDAPEVPEDIIAAVTCLITETGESLQGSRGIARRMADAGLLVGTTPEAPKCEREHLPSHSVRICLATLSDDFLADLARGAGSPSGPVADAAHRERERRRRVEGRA